MGLSKSRTITIIVAFATLTSNTIFSLVLYQLPDDRFHLARNFGWYLHVVNILSVFGLIGAIRQHALSISIFSNFLILDTALCTVPYSLLLNFLYQLSNTICSDPSPDSASHVSQNPASQFLSAASSLPETPTTTSTWFQQTCYHGNYLPQLILAACIPITLLKFFGALRARSYAKALWKRDSVGDMEIAVVEIREYRDEAPAGINNDILEIKL